MRFYRSVVLIESIFDRLSFRFSGFLPAPLIFSLQLLELVLRGLCLLPFFLQNKYSILAHRRVRLKN